jgi:hypothetical protein
MTGRRKILFSVVSLQFVLVSLLAGCAGDSSAHEMQMAPLEQMPAEVQAAPAAVREAYQFAAANPETMQALPCYCGCGPVGHTSNYSCYVSGENDDGSLEFDAHALGCSICVDITQDAMRLLEQGKSVPEVRAYVDSTYAQYGPSNMP